MLIIRESWKDEMVILQNSCKTDASFARSGKINIRTRLGVHGGPRVNWDPNKWMRAVDETRQKALIFESPKYYWFEMIFLCWIKFTTVILPLSLMIIGKFSGDHAVTVLQQNNFWGQILIGLNQSNWKSILSWELWNMQMFSPSEMTSQLLTGHVQQCYFGNSWTLCWN